MLVLTGVTKYMATNQVVIVKMYGTVRFTDLSTPVQLNCFLLWKNTAAEIENAPITYLKDILGLRIKVINNNVIFSSALNIFPHENLHRHLPSNSNSSHWSNSESPPVCVCLWVCVLVVSKLYYLHSNISPVLL